MTKDTKAILLSLVLLLLFAIYSAGTEASEYRATMHSSAAAYNVPESMLYNIAYLESRFREDVIHCRTLGKAGERGIMQIMPQYHSVDACNPEISIQYAAKYIFHLYTKTGTWWGAAASYNWGVGNYTKWKLKLKVMPHSVAWYATYVTRDL